MLRWKIVEGPQCGKPAHKYVIWPQTILFLQFQPPCALGRYCRTFSRSKSQLAVEVSEVSFCPPLAHQRIFRLESRFISDYPLSEKHPFQDDSRDWANQCQLSKSLGSELHSLDGLIRANRFADSCESFHQGELKGTN